MAPIRSIAWVVLFAILLRCSGNSFGFSKRDSTFASKFSCMLSTDEKISFSRVCDGILDCSNGYDENGSCSDEGSLIYYTYVEELVHHGNVTSDGEYHYCAGETLGHHYINVNLIYLNEAERYSFAFLNESFEEKQLVTRDGLSLDSIQINWEGPQLDLYYLKHKKQEKIDLSFRYWGITEMMSNYTTNLYRIRVMRDNFASDAPVRPGSLVMETMNYKVLSMKNLVYDWIASNIYCIYDRNIKVCDKNFIICVDLSTKFAENPTFLAIAHYERLLFWLEEENSERFHLYKYTLNDTTKAKRIPVEQKIKDPMWLTVDFITKRIYWMYKDDHVNVTFGSITFDGTGEKKISPSTTISDKTSSFAVFKNTIYWPETEEGLFIWACRVDECEPYVLTTGGPQFDTKPTKNQKFKMGSLMINHKPISSDKIKNPCVSSSCSHLCVPETETSYQCYCEHGPKPNVQELESGFCENKTLLVAYGNTLYIVGLLIDSDRPPMVRQFTMNISSISAVAYESSEGYVFLAEKGTQSIYLWSPRTKELQLLVQNGPGTIRLIEYDNYANNLYWIDPVNHVIKIMNMDSHQIVNLLEGNSTYSPFNLVLIPQRRHMIVLFSRNSQETTMEQISMDGDPYSRMILYSDDEADGPYNVFLRYVNPLQLVAMLDKQINKIRYLHFNKDSTFQYYADFQNAIVDGDPGKIECMTTVGRSLIWLDDKLTIHRVPFGGYPQVSLSIFGKQSIDLGLKKLDDAILNVVPVESYGELHSECLRNNGYCEELCALADNYLGYSCLCTNMGILFNITHCNHTTTTTTPSIEEHTVPSTSTETEKTTSSKPETTSPPPDTLSSTENQKEKAIPTAKKYEGHFNIWKMSVFSIVILFVLYIFRNKLRKYLHPIIQRFRRDHEFIPERLNDMYDEDSTL